MMDDLHHGLREGDRLRSERRESMLTVESVRDTTVDFGGDVGEWSHRKVHSLLEAGTIEVVDEEEQ